jgi:site-specific DNA-methyltransferase (cytosine-N4-specific)
LEAAIQYELLSKGTYEATELTRGLAALGDQELAESFAKHILLRLGGIRVVEAAQQMKLDQLSITGDTLARYLSNQGFPVTEHNTAINSMRMWLGLAGIFATRGWEVNALRKRALIGLDDDEIASIVSLTKDQQAFVVALCRINPAGDYPAAEVRNLAESIVGHTFARASLPTVILEPLSQIGLVEYKTKGTGGGKSSTLRLSPKFRADVLAPFIEHAVKNLDAVLTAYYKKTPAEIYAELDSNNTFIKGKALEAYGVHIMRLLGLRFVGWRKRARATTGRSEIDVVMTGMLGGQPSRWQIQCKNTPGSRAVDVEDVAKEVGLLPLTKATHIMLLANCRVTKDAQDFAVETMRHSPVIIFLLDITDYNQIKNAPGDLPIILRAKSEDVAALPRPKTIWDF